MYGKFENMRYLSCEITDLARPPYTLGTNSILENTQDYCQPITHMLSKFCLVTNNI